MMETCRIVMMESIIMDSVGHVKTNRDTQWPGIFVEAETLALFFSVLPHTALFFSVLPHTQLYSFQCFHTQS